MQTRPCPTFGRPVHLGSPHRLRPGTSPHALQIPSHDGHPALRSITSSGFRSALAVSSFRLCARLDVSIPSAFFGQRGFIPAFGYGAPHSSVRGTLTLLNNMLLSSHSFLVRLFHSLLHAGLSRRTVTWMTAALPVKAKADFERHGNTSAISTGAVVSVEGFSYQFGARVLSR